MSNQCTLCGADPHDCRKFALLVLNPIMLANMAIEMSMMQANTFTLPPVHLLCVRFLHITRKKEGVESEDDVGGAQDISGSTSAKIKLGD